MACHTSPWYQSLESLKENQRDLMRGDILALDRGYFKHYVIINCPLPVFNDYECLHLESCGQLSANGYNCVNPIEINVHNHDTIKSVRLSDIVGESKVRIDNQYPVTPGVKKRLKKISNITTAINVLRLFVNCEALANYIRSEVAPDQQLFLEARQWSTPPVSTRSSSPVVTTSRHLQSPPVKLNDTRDCPMITKWFNSWQALVQEQKLALYDVLAFDRGFLNHYAVVIDVTSDDYLCIDLQKSDAVIGWCCPNSNSSTTGTKG